MMYYLNVHFGCSRLAFLWIYHLNYLAFPEYRVEVADLEIARVLRYITVKLPWKLATENSPMDDWELVNLTLPLFSEDNQILGQNFQKEGMNSTFSICSFKLSVPHHLGSMIQFGGRKEYGYLSQGCFPFICPSNKHFLVYLSQTLY